MNPNDNNQFNPDQNPFEAIFAQSQQPPAPAAPAAPVAPPQALVAAAEGGEPVGPEELMVGKTGDNTKPLLMAIQSLHNYIAGSTDSGTIQLVRNLISALTQLVARDQKAAEQLSQQQTSQGQQAPQGQQTPMA